MRLFIDYELNRSGKSKFLRRLIPNLEKIGVQVVSKEKYADVALGISKWRKASGKIKRVLRVDGIAVEKDKLWKNEYFRKCIKSADLVIFQSKFARDYVIKNLVVIPNKTRVIYNGVDPKEFDIKPAEECYGNYNIMFAHWGKRKYKNLQAHIDYAKDHPETTFLLAGECKAAPTKNLRLLGHLDTPTLNSYIKMCNKMVYLATLDWCPNAVIEARVAGLDVIYNARCEAVKELCAAKIEDLYIQNVAKKYMEAFGAVCGNP